VPELADPSVAAGSTAGQAILAGLQALDRRCIDHGAGLPRLPTPPPVMTMVVYRVAGRVLLSPLQQVAKVLTVPSQITRVPGTRPWVLGVANNRGTLLPIYDIEGSLMGTPARRTAQDRILVVRQQELPFGILVGGPVGVHHCTENMAAQVSAASLGPLGPLVEGGYMRGIERLPVISLGRLSELPQFASAAA
jgi:twitching motility protein PilI